MEQNGMTRTEPMPETHSCVTFRAFPLAGLAKAEERDMVALATDVCPGSGSYVLPRLRSYAGALVASDDHGLAAFQLVDQFEECGECFVYLGPLFSRGGACVPLLCNLVQELLDQGQGFHLLTEVQNPEAILLFKALFLNTSCPGLSQQDAPVRVREIAATFERHLRHIHALDVARLRTRSAQTLFRRKPGCEAVVRWLEARGVHLERGESLVMVVSCATEQERARTADDLRDGRRRLRDWARWRPRMLACFEPDACHA